MTDGDRGLDYGSGAVRLHPAGRTQFDLAGFGGFGGGGGGLT